MSQSPTINGLDSPPPPSPLQIDATPPRPRPAGGAEQINLFFSPANSEAPSARGSYVRQKSPPQVYTRTARTRAYDDEDDDDDDDERGDRRGGEVPLPDPKRQRQRVGTSSVAGRSRAVPSAQNQASALALFDDLDPLPSTTSLANRNADNVNGNRNDNRNGNETLFDPLMGPAGMMEDDTGGRAREGEEGKKRSMPKMDVER